MPDRPRDVSAEKFYSIGKKYKVLWLLHGTFGDHTDWIRHTNIELYACELDLIVVLPSALNSDYSNWPGFACGFDMESYLTKELMPLVYNWLPASDKREDNFIAGLSMGGFGAAQYAVWYPEKFAAAALLSGSPMDWKKDRQESVSTLMPDRNKNVIDSMGGIDNLLNSHRNVWDRIGELANSGTLPRLYATCGTDDFIYKSSYLPFKEYAIELGLDATFEEVEGYTHEWRFWDLAIQRALNFFGLVKTDSGNKF